MAAIYQLNGQSVYDYNGVTYSANTGQPVSKTAAATPPAATPAATTTPAPAASTVTRTSTATPTTTTPAATTTPASTGPTYLQSLQTGLQQAQSQNPPNTSYIASLQQAIQAAQSNGTASTPVPSDATVTKNGTSIPSTTVNPTSTTTPTTVAAGSYDPSWASYGVTQATWNSMNALQQAQVGAALTAAHTMYSTTTSTVNLNDALAAAATDPTILSTYADAKALDTNTFQQSLQQLQQSTSTAQQNQQTQFENDRRALAENSAAAGQAYSGFRGRAQAQLAQNESGIVTSSKSQLQQQLDQLTSSFESKYGSAATTAASTSFLDPYASSNVSLSGLSTPTSPQSTTLTGPLAGGVTGTATTAKNNAITNLADTYVTAGQIPDVVPAT